MSFKCELQNACEMCNREMRKYKCSKCSRRTCSVECYKEHKNKGCTTLAGSKKNLPGHDQENTDVHSQKFILPPFPTRDTVDPHKLEELRNCEPLKDLLRNPHLRNLLKEIEDAPHPGKAMKAAMQEPLFIEFADECMKIVDAQRESNR